MSLSDPHKDGEIYRYGAPLEEADGVVILLHGRGASARDILGLAPAITWTRPRTSG
jgi:phospholipase/carboxylesterase